MKLKSFLLTFTLIILSGCANDYVIKSHLTNGVKYDDLKTMSYSLGSVVEKKSDEKEYSKFDAEQTDNMKKKLSEELKKGLQKGIQPSEKDKVIIDVFVDNNVECFCDHGYKKLSYAQTGYVLLKIIGTKQNDKNKQLFNIDTAYRMDGSAISGVRSWVCDSDAKIDRIIANDIFPLAVKEIGQDRVIKKD